MRAPVAGDVVQVARAPGLGSGLGVDTRELCSVRVLDPPGGSVYSWGEVSSQGVSEFGQDSRAASDTCRAGP